MKINRWGVKNKSACSGQMGSTYIRKIGVCNGSDCPPSPLPAQNRKWTKRERRRVYTYSWTVLQSFVHVCFVQVTFLNLVWRSRRANAPQCVHFPTDIRSVIQEGEITVEKCTQWGASAPRERHTLSLGQNKHGHNNSAPLDFNPLSARPLVSVPIICHLL